MKDDPRCVLSGKIYILLEERPEMYDMANIKKLTLLGEGACSGSPV